MGVEGKMYSVEKLTACVPKELDAEKAVGVKKDHNLWLVTPV